MRHHPAWAFAKSQPLATAAFEALGRAAVREFKALNHTDKSMLLYAFAEAGRYQEAARLSALVADSAATDRHGCVAGWSLQSLALTAHALAKMGVPSEELFRAIASEAVPRLREARASHLQVLVWSHAAQRYAAPGLFNAVAKEIRPRLGEMSGQGLALTAWAYSTLAPHSQVTLALLEEVFRVVEGMLHPSSSAQDGAALAPEDMSRLAWSMAAAGDGSLLNRSRLWSLCRPWQSAGASLGCMDLISMFQAELSVIRGELRHASSDVAAQGSSVDPIPALRDPLRSLARQRWEEQAISTRSSRFQAEVAKALRLAGFQCREEVLTSDGLFSVDIMIEVSGIQIAVEADGTPPPGPCILSCASAFVPWSISAPAENLLPHSPRPALLPLNLAALLVLCPACNCPSLAACLCSCCFSVRKARHAINGRWQRCLLLMERMLFGSKVTRPAILMHIAYSCCHVVLSSQQDSCDDSEDSTCRPVSLHLQHSV